MHRRAKAACSVFLMNAVNASTVSPRARFSAMLAKVRLCWSCLVEYRILKEERCGFELRRKQM
jgi:hypothetical protein